MGYIKSFLLVNITLFVLLACASSTINRRYETEDPLEEKSKFFFQLLSECKDFPYNNISSLESISIMEFEKNTPIKTIQNNCDIFYQSKEYLTSNDSIFWMSQISSNKRLNFSWLKTAGFNILDDEKQTIGKYFCLLSKPIFSKDLSIVLLRFNLFFDDQFMKGGTYIFRIQGRDLRLLKMFCQSVG